MLQKAVEESGIRAVLSYGMIDFGDDEKREHEIKENIALFENVMGWLMEELKYFWTSFPVYSFKGFIGRCKMVS